MLLSDVFANGIKIPLCVCSAFVHLCSVEASRKAKIWGTDYEESFVVWGKRQRMSVFTVVRGGLSNVWKVFYGCLECRTLVRLEILTECNFYRFLALKFKFSMKY
jgi:hypothetical protein